MIKTYRNIFLCVLIGMFGGYFFLHPYAMVTHGLMNITLNPDYSLNIKDLWLHSLEAFSLTMIPMTVSFIIFGGFTGLLFGIIIDRKKKLLNTKHESEKILLRLESAERLKEASLDTIYRLSKAAEYRDEDTGSHIIRMSNYAAAIAEQMGLNENTVEAILYAAPMHDIGKIATPDSILLKPGKLNPDEWEIMKLHTVHGAEILKRPSTGFIKPAEIIALTHHEKWDGSGYPSGLAGEDIPLVGRIVAIADVFDALTSKRPYKKVFSLDRAFGTILENKGLHFDPTVVEAFFNIELKLLSIKDRYID